MKAEIESLKKAELKYLRKIKDLESELEILRRNQDVLNRSQHLSMEMENYND